MQSQQHLGCTLNINSFEFIVGFYSRDHKMYRTFSWKLRSWLISILTLSKWTHCSFQLKAKDFDSSLFAVDGKEASLVRTESLHAYFGKPDKEVSLGIIEFEISDYDKVENYFNTKPKGTTLDAVLWFLGLKRNIATCATVTTDVLNILGYKTKRCVSPKQLLKEINNANDNPWRTGKIR